MLLKDQNQTAKHIVISLTNRGYSLAFTFSLSGMKCNLPFSSKQTPQKPRRRCSCTHFKASL